MMSHDNSRHLCTYAHLTYLGLLPPNTAWMDVSGLRILKL